ncbi:DEAD/DEAH box helicase [Ureaplasma ceti]|uniref:DEAD/DEAH box helicase n=1 Tax=Ureaplasma ceti TaxID=3119530 RepID=A0ABP9U723_9BACT
MNSRHFKVWIEKTLQDQNIVKATEIQQRTLPLTLKHHNVIGVAPTGTGKTLAFLLPILNELNFEKGIQSVIVCPTRELARQIKSKIDDFKKQNSNLKAVLWIGGEDIDKLISQASKNNNYQIVVTTPSRFIEMVEKVPTLNFKDLRSIVLDEADMLLDLGFFPEIDQMFQRFKSIDGLQKMAFSATLHELLRNNLSKYFEGAKIIATQDSIYANEKIKHYLIKNTDKFHALSVIANQIEPYLCLVFTNTKKQADEIYKYFLEQNRSVINLHGGLQTRERKNNLKDIQNLKYQYVIATDLASRGLDIEGASHVISWNLADDPEWYVHRAGRAGRSKYEGISYVLYDEQDNEKLVTLTKKGIKFENLQIKNNKLVKAKIRLYKKPIINQEQEDEIKQLVKNTKKTVKPGYKKKLKQDIAKIKQKHKRKHIEASVKQQRIKKYKQENAKK